MGWLKKVRVRNALPTGQMNRLESDFAAHLEVQRIAGEIKLWLFDRVNLRLADKTFFRPDFMVVDKDDYVVFYETKGQWFDDAKVKIKVAAEQFPFPFIAVYRKGKSAWEYEEF